VWCDQVGEAARRDDRSAVGAQLDEDARDDRVDLAREPVDEPRLQRGSRRLADHALGRRERHLREPGGAREQRVHRDLHTGRQHAAGELAGFVHDVEVRRGAEVDHDRRRAVPFTNGNGVRDAVRPHFARVVVADRHSGRDSRPEHEKRRTGPPLGE